MRTLTYDRALKSIWEFISAANKYIDTAAPWTLHKEGKDAKLDSVMYTLFEAIRQVAVMITPFMPETGQKMYRQLGIAQKRELQTVISLKKWGSLPGGTRTFRGPSLFPRIEDVPDISEEEPSTDSGQGRGTGEEEEKQEPEEKDMENVISIEEFARVEIISGKILEADNVPQSKKLVRITVDTGQKRQIVAGIAEHYSPEELVGLSIAVVSNLAPVKLMGVESNGMLLAAQDKNGLSLLTFDKEVQPGVRIK
jgi:methionyl-tRNA synthetase